jgi:hypothetical protein
MPPAPERAAVLTDALTAAVRDHRAAGLIATADALNGLAHSQHDRLLAAHAAELVGDVNLQATGQSGAGGMFRVAVPAFGGGNALAFVPTARRLECAVALSGSRGRSAANRPSSKWTGAPDWGSQPEFWSAEIWTEAGWPAVLRMAWMPALAVPYRASRPPTGRPRGQRTSTR